MIVRVNAIATLAFTVTAVFAAVVFSTAAQWVGAIVAISCFFAGIGAFIWSYFVAVNRSRTEQIAVFQLYFLTGGVAPPSVQRPMWALLGVQIIVGFVTAFARANNVEGEPGTSLALGVLVPVLGLGLNGLWAARYGTYDVRKPDVTPRPPTGAKTDQNGHHG